MQHEITEAGPLLDEGGLLREPGFSKRMVLAYNPENLRLFGSGWLGRLRLKEWDYYATTTPEFFFSATVSHVGYIGLVFAYFIDFASKKQWGKTLVLPLGRGVRLPRSSDGGDVHFHQGKVSLSFLREPERRLLEVRWPGFARGVDLAADLTVEQPAALDSMVIATPIGQRHFYYNHKVNCMPTEGRVVLGDREMTLTKDRALTSLDWGRGIWDYRSFWNWASASGFLPDGRSFGLNLGAGFGDLSAATENCFYLDGRMTKLEGLKFDYDPGDYMRPWRFVTSEGRLDLTFTPFFDRQTKFNILLLKTRVHQMFGHYTGTVQTDSGEQIRIDKLIGWAEEHHAKW